MNPIRTAIGIAVVVALLVLLFSVKSCKDSRQEAAQARHENNVATAHIQAAEKAADVVEQRTGQEAELRQVVTEAAKDIANAEGSEQKVTPAVRDAALRAACKLRDYRDEPACGLFKADPR